MKIYFPADTVVEVCPVWLKSLKEFCKYVFESFEDELFMFVLIVRLKIKMRMSSLFCVFFFIL